MATYPPNPSVNFGFLGSMQLQSLMGKVNINNIRFTSSDLKMKQESEVLASTSANFDKSVYIMKNKEVEGGVQFPLIVEEMQGNIVQSIWQQSIVRQKNGRLYPFDVILKYYKGHTYRYSKCLINNFEINSNHSDVVNCSINLIGMDKKPPDNALNEPRYTHRNSKAIIWNSVNVDAGIDGVFTIPTESVRNFRLNVVNNVERLYTFGDKTSTTNDNLYPSDLIARQRDISGSITIVNINDGASKQALDNDNQKSADGYVRFFIDEPSCDIQWGIDLPNILFHIEEVGMSVNIIESVINFKCILGSTTTTGDGMQDTFEIFSF